MAESNPITFRLERTKWTFPSEEDFYFGPDQREAWRNFGTLTLEEAYLRFLEAPWTYQEDFMWMGPVAFAYYFPVIDKYLRELICDNEIDDGSWVWILGCGVRSQFRWKDGRKPAPQVVQEIAELSALVQANTDHYSRDPHEQDRIAESWREVDEEVAACRGQS